MSRPNWPIAQQGRPWADIEAELDTGRRGDTRWTSHKNFSASYFAGDDVFHVAREAFVKHIGDNVTHRHGLHPSIVRYERETGDFLRALLNAPDDAPVTITTGGSESLFLAMKVARERARVLRPDSTASEIILTHTTYPVFNKAAHALGLKVVQVPRSNDYRADPQDIEAAISDRTIMMVGGAPPFPYGLVDPLPEMSKLAEAHDIWLHADCCIGGFVLPFAEALGRPVRAFDFRLAGVQSISIDFHKYGYAMRGCSAVLLRNADDKTFQEFACDVWPAGSYLSDTMSGSRNAGPVASAWAVMNYLGYDGYKTRMGHTLAATDRLVGAIDAIAGLEVHGRPEGIHFSFGSPDLDMIAIGDELMERGWMMNLQTEPESLLLMLSTQHDAAAVDQYAGDLADVVEGVRAGRIKRRDNAAAYGIY